MARGLLLAAFDFSGADAGEFHDWYDLEHLPERAAIAGFDSSERWISVENPQQAVATYDLASIGALRSPDYRAVSHENVSPWTTRLAARSTLLIRFEGIQTLPGDAETPEGAGALLVNAINIAAEHSHDFHAWYDTEHIPALASVPGTLAARRYLSAETGGSHRHVALYHLASADVASSDAWKRAVDTPWSARVRGCFRDRLRLLATRYHRTRPAN